MRLRKAWKRFRTERQYRNRMMTQIAGTMNLVTVVFSAAAALKQRSLWFLSIAVYYSCLVLLRARLLHHAGKMMKEEDPLEAVMIRDEAVRNCGLYLFLLTFGFGFVTTRMINHGDYLEYPGFMFRWITAYSIWCIIWASANMIHDHGRNILLTSLRIINLMASFAGFYILLAALIRLLDISGGSRVIILAVAGAFLMIIFLQASIWMILAPDKIQGKEK